MKQKEILQQFHTFYDALPEGICLIRDDKEETLLFANRTLLEIFQCAHMEDLQKLANGRFQPLVDPVDYKPLTWLARPHGSQYISFRIRTAKNLSRRLEGSLRKIAFPQVGMIWVLSLTSSLQDHSAMKQNPVTGLMGLHAFYQEARNKAVLRCAGSSQSDFTPVYLNITNFNIYNVTHGIPAGDRLLRFVARTLQAFYPNQLMAQISGDSFALLAPSGNLLSTLTQVIQTVDRAIDNPNITLKAGIYHPRKGQAIQDIFHAFDMAQMACNSVKKDASSSYAFYSTELAKKQQLRSFVLENFQKALDGGQIQAYFQPVVRTLSGRLCGLEALARWIDPEKGMIPPDSFIPILEESRLIHKLDAYVLDQAGRRLQERQLKHQPLIPISCNFSRLDFILSDPYQLVEETIRKYQLQRKSLCIEITESALIHDSYAFRKILEKFHQVNYQLWLDDFGSAYSSLNILHSYHFDELKIDRGFWQDLNEKGKKIITSIVLMAKTLGIHTLAEGVETEEQVAFLKKINCEKIQGYYYSKPLPYEALLCHLQSRGILTENPLETPLFDKAGLVNVLTDIPISLFTYNGESITLLYVNEAHEKSLQSMGIWKSMTETRQLHAANFPQWDKVRAFLDQSTASSRKSSMIYGYGSQYFRLCIRKLAEANGQYLCQGELYNVTVDQEKQETSRKL
ncbi:EAL domain-containing protein [Acidaminococcus sp.]|uniref:EAL domain-containing protein n=1 Tax=Acidaminococcus sp. TaxID=1872103 RepID=UPI003D7C4233